MTSIWNSISSYISGVMNTIKNTVSSIWNNVKAAVSSIIGQIYEVIHAGFERAVGYVKPYLKALHENTGDASLLNIQQLETLLEQNTEQRETLHKLMGQGYIDQILFTQENNALLSQANDYRNEIEALNRSQSLDATKVYETERLLHFCERGEMQMEYSEELFELFVDHIEVYSRQKIGFALHCGLILKEMI